MARRVGLHVERSPSPNADGKENGKDGKNATNFKISPEEADDYRGMLKFVKPDVMNWVCFFSVRRCARVTRDRDAERRKPTCALSSC